MKIAYACNGEGRGHAGRLLCLLPGLETRHTVHVYAPKAIRSFLQSRLGPKALRPIPGLHFAKRGERVLFWGTLWRNLGLMLAAPFLILRLAAHLRRHRYQAVLSDFEPFLAWAGRLAGLPVIQLNHPGVLLRRPAATPEEALAQAVAWAMEGPWTRRFHISFFGGDLGPLLRPSLKAQAQRRGDYLLVYLKDGFEAAFLPALEALARKDPSLRWRLFPDPRSDFDEALAGCRAVVCAAGHQTLSEALVLRKPVLALAQSGQTEQALNARMLELSGRGRAARVSRFAQDLEEFWAELPRFEREALRTPPPGFRFDDSLEETLARLEAALVPGAVEPGADALAG